jgi:L-alanine-DL-glutamate epimerase-like enolase superfamily enzyme
MAENARMLADKGIRHFKIKVHNEVEEDVACVNAIRAGGASDIDANQSYASKDEIRALKAESRIDLAEDR